MPTDAQDVYCVAHKNGTITCMARVVGAAGAAIAPADIASGTYSVYLLDDQDPDSRTAVDGHAAVALTILDCVFAALQTDARWTKDATGYNFRHTIPISSKHAFATAGRNYLVEYRLVPVLGQVIVLRFRVAVI